MADKIPIPKPPSPGGSGKTKLLVGMIVVLVVVIGAMGYVMFLAPAGEGPITTPGEANVRAAGVQEDLQGILGDLGDISDSL